MFKCSGIRCAAALVLMFSIQANAGYDFADIDRWVGSGTNQAALVIDWNDGLSPYSEVWGYRFTTSVSAFDMFVDIVSAESRLFTKYDSDGGFGAALFSIGYDRDNDGFSLTPAGPTNTFNADGTRDENIVAGVTDSGNISITNVSVDSDDSYFEDWFTSGYFAFYHENDAVPFNGASPYNGGAWETAATGLSGHTVNDQSWIGLSWAPGFNASTPAVPEPASLTLLGLGTLAMLRRR